MSGTATLRSRVRGYAGTGLRARKRRSLLAHIQATALDMFDAQGFQQVTIEQVAAASDVSPSTVYRHFGSKEHLVLHDELHLSMTLMAELFVPGGPPLEAFYRAVHLAIGSLEEIELTNLRRRLGYVYTVPSIKGTMLADLDETERYVRELFSAELKSDAESLKIRVLVSSLTTAYRVALHYWYDHPDASLLDVVDDALAPFNSAAFYAATKRERLLVGEDSSAAS